MVSAVSAGMNIEGGGWGAEVKASATYKTQTSQAQTSSGVRYAPFCLFCSTLAPAVFNVSPLSINPPSLSQYLVAEILRSLRFDFSSLYRYFPHRMDWQNLFYTVGLSNTCRDKAEINPELLDMWEALPISCNTEEDCRRFYDFVDQFGTHVIKSVTTGSRIPVSTM